MGQYNDECLPIHLQKNNFESMKNRVDNIMIRNASLQNVLRDSQNVFDAFSLSDFSSYLKTFS